jgi:pterin-4a-carbinolamine dehydratase
MSLYHPQGAATRVAASATRPGAVGTSVGIVVDDDLFVKSDLPRPHRPVPTRRCSMRQKRTTARAFHDAGGVDDWRVLYGGAYAYYRIGSFAEGARFVAAIADAADAIGHSPDVDLRREGVTLRTFSSEAGTLSERDIELARRISAVARTLHLVPDPSQVQAVAIAVAQDVGRDVRPFWAAALSWHVRAKVCGGSWRRRRPNDDARPRAPVARWSGRISGEVKRCRDKLLPRERRPRPPATARPW